MNTILRISVSLAILLCPLALAVSGGAGSAEPESADTAASSCLNRLKKATSFDGRATGYAGQKSLSYLSFEACLKEGAKIRTQLESTKGFSGAGKLYAAELLRRCDKAAGEKALKSLLGDKTSVSYNPGGCSINTASVGKVAEQLLSGKLRLD